jgi:hypothetical protein
VFEDIANKHLLICQCKYQNFDKPVEETEVNDFFNRHGHFANREWVDTHGSDAARDALVDYGERLQNGYITTYYFISTGKASFTAI